MEISILRLTDEMIRNSNVDNASKKVLYANVGRYIVAEDTERGWVFFFKTLADSEKEAQVKWNKLETSELF